MAVKKLEVLLTGKDAGASDALAGVGGASDGLAGKLGSIGAVAATAFAAVVAGAALAGGALFAIGSDFDSAYDTIRVGTGATGEALGSLKDDFKSVVSSVPADFGDAGTAIADLNTRLGLTGEPLQEMSAQVLELSRLTGGDVSTNIEKTSRVFGDWGIATDQQSEKLDALFRASQATGPSVEQLSDMMVRFGSPLRQLGFEFDETAALIGKFEKEGVNTELVLGSMRVALGRMARDGEPAGETLARVTDEIKNAGSVSEANAMALELFGARAGPDMAAAIREGRFEIGDLLDTVSNGSETIMAASADTQSFSEKWQIFKNKAMVGIEPLATKVFDAVGNGLDSVSEKVGPMVDQFMGKAMPMLGDLGDAWERDGIAGVTSKLGEIWDKGWPVMQAGGRQLLGRLRGWLVAEGPGIARAVGSGIYQAGNWLIQQWPAFAMMMAGFYGRVGSWIADVGVPWLGEKAMQLGPALWQWIQDAYPPFVARMGELWAQVGAWFLGTGIPWMATKGFELWSALGEWLWTEAAPALLRGLVSLMAAIGAWLAGTGVPWLRAKAGEWFGTLRDKAAEKGGEALDWLKTLPGMIGGWITGTALPGLRAKAGEWFGSLKEKAAEKGEEALDWLRDLPGRAVDALGDLGSTLLNAGRDLIQGLIDGVRDKMGPLDDVLGGITDRIPDWKGPPERDEVLLRPAGQLIMQGLVAGIDDGERALWDRLGAITRGLNLDTDVSLAAPAITATRVSAASGAHAPAAIAADRPIRERSDEGPVMLRIDKLQMVTPDGRVLAQEIDVQVLAQRVNADRRGR